MIQAIMIGSGARGIGAYGGYALKHPEEYRFIAVADPDPMRRGYFAAQHQIPAAMQFEDAAAILAKPKFADACFICTQDHQHYEPAIAAMRLGYHLFLEKPMAIYPRDCMHLGQIAKECKVQLMIGHVLRYTPFFKTIRRLIDAGTIGKLMTIQHNENVSYWHQAHSYVRGNWRNVMTASPMILAKSCHDLDLIIWLADSTPNYVASFGDLTHFKAMNAPEGAPKQCIDGCPVQETCPYFAPRVYTNAPDWMRLAVSNDLSNASMLERLKTGPYGRCVYLCDNDVVDHQVVIMEFKNGVTAAFTMTAFTHENTRTLKLMGTEGEIRGHMDKNEVEVHRFGSSEVELIRTDLTESGHGGGDDGIMKEFAAMLETKTETEDNHLDGAILAHLAAFAAETSRLEKKTVDFDRFVDGWKI
jgi:predicted dehydrogenase